MVIKKGALQLGRPGPIRELVSCTLGGPGVQHTRVYGMSKNQDIKKKISQTGILIFQILFKFENLIITEFFKIK
jgi:hypothetical protein